MLWSLPSYIVQTLFFQMEQSFIFYFFHYHLSDPFGEGDFSSCKSTEWYIVQERVIIHLSGNGSTISTYSWLGDIDATRDTQGNPFLLFPPVPFSYHSILDLTPADRQPDVFTELTSVIFPISLWSCNWLFRVHNYVKLFFSGPNIYQHRFLLFKCSPTKSCFHSSQPD